MGFPLSRGISAISSPLGKRNPGQGSNPSSPLTQVHMHKCMHKYPRRAKWPFDLTFNPLHQRFVKAPTGRQLYLRGCEHDSEVSFGYLLYLQVIAFPRLGRCCSCFCCLWLCSCPPHLGTVSMDGVRGHREQRPVCQGSGFSPKQKTLHAAVSKCTFSPCA